MSLRATLSCSCIFTYLFGVIYVCYYIQGCEPRGISWSSQGSLVLRGSPNHEDTATVVWELGVAIDWLLNYCWPSPAQWILVPSSTELMIIFYCLYGSWMLCASFKYLVRTSQRTPMNLAVTSNTTVSTRQRKNDSHCLLVMKQQQNRRRFQALGGAFR
jgi:hypothetical protein